MKLESAVVFIRLVTGEDLVSELTEVSANDGREHYYILNNPMKVLYLNSIDKPGYMSVSLTQWVFQRICEDQTFNVYPDDILTMGYPTDKMINYYWNCVDDSYNRRDENAKKTEYVDREQETTSDDAIDENQTEDTEALEMLREFMETISGKTGKRTIH